MIKQLKYQRLLAMLYLGAALGILYFWWQFFNGALFTTGELEALMPHFQAYYLWERSFVIPDVVLSFAMLASSFFLWTNRWVHKARLLSAACAGAALFLGLLDLTYGFSSGLYQLEHRFADAALEAGLSITMVGVVAVAVLFFSPQQKIQ